jgi:hypothetical protein
LNESARAKSVAPGQPKPACTDAAKTTARATMNAATGGHQVRMVNKLVDGVAGRGAAPAER